MVRKQSLKIPEYPVSSGAKQLVEKYEQLLAALFPKAYCRSFAAPDGRIRLLVVDDQFNQVQFSHKHKYVLERLNAAVAARRLSKRELDSISSIDVYSPKELV